MAIYEYCCRYCGVSIEVLQKPSDAPLKTCKSCGKLGLKKMPSMTTFHLKGGGWYNQGYEKKSAGKNKTASKDSGDSASGSK